MIIKPKCKKFICINSHPGGCAMNVKEEIDQARQSHLTDGPMNVLVIGSSNGFGLSSRICAAYSMGANTMGVFSSKPPSDRREATSGWYNSYALAKELKSLPTHHVDLNADAFDPQTKAQAIDILRREFPQGLDLVIYSIAAARRKVGDNLYKSSIRPVGEAVTTLDLDLESGVVREVQLQPASPEEVESTRKVMGGEDWALWIEALHEAGVLKPGCKSFAYTYIGSSQTKSIYNDGAIGKAKDHVAQTAQALSQSGRVNAQVISQPAVVTQSSSVIPSISLYMTILMEIFHQAKYDNSTQAHINRMMETCFLNTRPGHLVLNNEFELSEAIQQQVDKKWNSIVPGEILPEDIGNPERFRQAFLKLFGFGRTDIDYDADVEHYLV